MFDDLEAAARAFRAAEVAVEEAKQSVVDARAEVPRARERLAAAIVAAARAGARQKEIVRITGYTRETVRRICRAAGVEPRED